MGRRRNHRRVNLDIPQKANRVLNVVLVGLILILIRVWHLTVVQYDERVESARKPQRKVVVEPAKRGTIRDRFNIPLAINKMQYDVGVVYSQIQQVPTVVWEKIDGKKVRRWKRREYILELSKVLAKELDLDAERIEDLIHSKAAFYYHLPYMIKKDITEEQYYRLKMMEKDWVGLQVLRSPKRFYPHGRVAAEIIGYMGAISREQYENVIHEIKALQEYLTECESGVDAFPPPGIRDPEDASQRLHDLKEHAYSMHDMVGKSGVEGRFEELLRGYYGKRSYQSDARGNFLRELPESSDAQSGERLLLTLSVELQSFAEKLLIQNENLRPLRVSGVDAATQELLALKQPWIKGGAIVAMDPHSGEVIAMASHPRFDPNDFIPSGNEEKNAEKQSHIRRWFETDLYVSEIWDQKRPMEREAWNEGVVEEEVWLTWEKYLEFILPSKSHIRSLFSRIATIQEAIDVQQNFELLVSLCGHRKAYGIINQLYPNDQRHGSPLPVMVREDLEENFAAHSHEVERIKKNLQPYFSTLSSNYEKVLFLDLCQLIVDPTLFSEKLLHEVGTQSITLYRDSSAAMVSVRETVKKMTEELFHSLDYKIWREEFAKDFLKEKRAKEKAEKKYAKPYLDLLDSKENELFSIFWEEYQWDLLSAFITGKAKRANEQLNPYLKYFASWHRELLRGAHPAVSWRQAYTTLNKVVESISDDLIYDYLFTLRSYSDLNRKLYGWYRHLRRSKGEQLEKHLALAFYPRYGFGYARSNSFRQAAIQGSLFKIVTAYEALRQHHHRTGNWNPLEITDVVESTQKGVIVGYTKDGRPIPQLYKGGRLPRSASRSIGKIDLGRAIETSSNPYFSLLASEVIEHPDDLSSAARAFSFGSKSGIELTGEIAGKVPDDLEFNKTGLYSTAIGQHTLVVTPLQTAVMLSAIANGGKIYQPKIVHLSAGNEGVKQYPAFERYSIEMPNQLRGILLDGMHRVVDRTYSHTLGSLSRIYREHPEAIADFLDLRHQVVGKTSTSEAVENLDLDPEIGTNMYTHIWFGGITFEQPFKQSFLFKDRFGNPELVVVVYLKYGAWGNHAAPLAAQVVKKWKEIRAKSL